MISKYKIPLIYDISQLDNYRKVPNIKFPFVRFEYPYCCAIEIFCRFPESFNSPTIKVWFEDIKEFNKHDDIDAVIAVFKEYIEYYIFNSYRTIVEMTFNPNQQVLTDLLHSIEVTGRTKIVETFMSSDGDRELTKFTFKRNDR